jgi:hypothetical protein
MMFSPLAVNSAAAFRDPNRTSGRAECGMRSSDFSIEIVCPKVAVQKVRDSIGFVLCYGIFRGIIVSNIRECINGRQSGHKCYSKGIYCVESVEVYPQCITLRI